MMLKNFMSKRLIYLLFTTTIILLSSCAQQKLKVNCALYEGKADFDTLKWEIFPITQKNVAIYSSKKENNFDKLAPLLYVKSENLFALIPKEDNQRRFYKVVFDENNEIEVASRDIKVDGVADFRDIGGYFTTETEEIRWGKIYRSSKLSCIKPDGLDKVNTLKIKTLFDLRTQEEKSKERIHVTFPRTFNLPMAPSCNDSITMKLGAAQCKKSDAFLHMQDLYSSYTNKYDNQLAKLFDELLVESNYPILIESEMGTHRTGFVIAIIMAALNISEEEIYDNFLYNCKNVYISDNFDFGKQLKPDEQEALTTILSVQKSYLAYSFEKIKKENGSLEQYFTKKLNLSSEKREKLQQILLTH